MGIICSALVFAAMTLSSWIRQESHGEAKHSSENKQGPPVRHLIICIDGVGYSEIERMRSEARFLSFKEPSRMIAPFPTLTNISMAEILSSSGAPAATGYEDSFFDIRENKMRGGLWDRFQNRRFIKGSFRELFDYHPSAVRSGLGYVVPPVSTYVEAVSDLSSLKREFVSTSDNVFFAYLGSTDSLAHLGGRRMLRNFLKKLDSTIASIIRESDHHVQVTLFSDHGNHFRKYRRVSIKEPLRQSGFQLDSSLRGPQSVVIPQFGLIGTVALFTDDANEAAVARTLAGVRGVDFVTFETNGVVSVTSKRGDARIERRDGSYRYVIEKGDPLDLATVMRKLATEGKVGEDGFVGDRDWFEATCDTDRPDAVARVYKGTTGLVKNRANVLLGLEDGYYSGSSLLDLFAFLQATHGNLGREQSLGFVMNTKRSLSGFIRAEDVWSMLGSPRITAADVAFTRGHCH
jgi:hypothetical protein